MLPSVALYCLLAILSPCRGLMNLYTKSPLLAEDSRAVAAASALACAAVCSTSPQCHAFSWEPGAELPCNIIVITIRPTTIPEGVTSFRPKAFGRGQIIVLPKDNHSWTSAKALCESMNLIFMPAPNTFDEFFILSNYEGFIDAIKNDYSAKDTAGNDLDFNHLGMYFIQAPQENGCMGLFNFSTRAMDCNEAQPLPLHPLCLAP